MNPQSTRTRHPMARRRAWRHSEWWDVTNGCRDFWLYKVFFVCPLILLMVFDIWPQQVYWQIFALIAKTIWMKKTRTGVQLGRQTGIGVAIWKLCVFSSRWLWGEKTLKSQGFCHVLWNIVPIPLSHSSIGMFELLTVEIHWDPVEKSRPTTRCCILTASNVSKIFENKMTKIVDSQMPRWRSTWTSWRICWRWRGGGDVGSGARKTHQRPWIFFLGGHYSSTTLMNHWIDYAIGKMKLPMNMGPFFFCGGGCGGQCFRHAKENTADASAEAVPGNHEVWRWSSCTTWCWVEMWKNPWWSNEFLVKKHKKNNMEMF